MQVKNVANASAKHVKGGYAAVSSFVRYAHLSSGVWVSGCAAGLPAWILETTEDTEGHRKRTASVEGETTKYTKNEYVFRQVLFLT